MISVCACTFGACTGGVSSGFGGFAAFQGGSGSSMWVAEDPVLTHAFFEQSRGELREAIDRPLPEFFWSLILEISIFFGVFFGQSAHELRIPHPL